MPTLSRLPFELSRCAPGLLLALACLGGLQVPSAQAGSPPLMLANVYRHGMPLQDYWVSEKLDGIRGYWDGTQLLTRGGERIAAPAWFTAGWPAIPLDGELWAGRGQFAHAVSTARQQTPDEDAWRRMRFMVFDLPAHGGPFSERIPALSGVVSRIDQPWVQVVTQHKVPSHAALQALLDKTVALGGEGLMLHRGASLYQALRNDDLLKVKTHDDAEARVLGHVAGQGRFTGQVGALWVEAPAADGKPARRFKLGSGLSGPERQHPPPVGSWVTYRYRGLNDSGVPRFPTFVRVREDMPSVPR